jgi:hypothetical protein
MTPALLRRPKKEQHQQGPRWCGGHQQRLGPGAASTKALLAPAARQQLGPGQRQAVAASLS